MPHADDKRYHTVEPRLLLKPTKLYVSLFITIIIGVAGVLLVRSSQSSIQRIHGSCFLLFGKMNIHVRHLGVGKNLWTAKISSFDVRVAMKHAYFTLREEYLAPTVSLTCCLYIVPCLISCFLPAKVQGPEFI